MVVVVVVVTGEWNARDCVRSADDDEFVLSLFAAASRRSPFF